MSFNNTNPPREGQNVWSAGSRGSRAGFSRSDNENDDNFGNDDGSFRNNYSRGNRRGRGGGYGFRRQNNNNNNSNDLNDNGQDEIEILKDAIFIQNLPKNITRDDIQEAFSTVGLIKTDERSGGPKIWIYKDRMTGEGNGRATVTYEDEETATKAVSEYNDQHISSISSVVRVQLAQRRIRNDQNSGPRRFNNNRGYRGGHNNWNNNSTRPSGNNHWNNNRGGGGSGGSFRGRGNGFRGNRMNSYRGGNRGTTNPTY